MTPYRRDSIDRAFKTIIALQRKSGVTIRELSEILEFNGELPKTRHNCAKTWIDAASTHLPVVEIGLRRSQGVNMGALSTAYGIRRVGHE